MKVRCSGAFDDADDGADNGVVLMEDIAPGEYTLRETRRPSADYQTAAEVLVEVVADRPSMSRS